MITVITPFPGPIGPGMVIDVSTDIQFTPPPDALWSVAVVPTRNESRPLIGMTLRSDVLHVSGHLGTEVGGWVVEFPAIGAAEAEAVLLIVNFLGNGEQVLDSITVPTTWSPATAIQQVVRDHATGGAVHDPMLDTILAAVQKQAILTP